MKINRMIFPKTASSGRNNNFRGKKADSKQIRQLLCLEKDPLDSMKPAQPGWPVPRKIHKPQKTPLV